MKPSIIFCLAAWLTAMAAAGCGAHRHGDEAAGGGLPETETLPLAAYDSAYEVYAEVTPLAAGEASEIILHVTRLETFRPLEEGRLTVSLDAGGRTASAAAERLRPGIFRATLTPEAAGSCSLRFDVVTADGTAHRLTVPDVHVHADREAAHRAAEEAEAALHDAVPFAKETAWRVPFATEPSRREAFGRVIRAVAQVTPAPADEHVVTARMSGTVTLGADAPAEGTPVRAGQTLCHVGSAGLAEGNLAVRLREAEADWRLARQEYERKEALAADRIVAAADVAQAKARMEAAEAAYGNLRRHFADGRQAVTAPADGTVTQVAVRNGEYVEAGRPLMTVVQHRTLRLRAEVPARHARSLDRIVAVSVRTPDDGAVHTLEELGGRVVARSRAVGADGALPSVTLEVAATEALLPGSFAEVYLRTQGDAPAVTVPNGALVEEMGTHFVFVQLTPERFEKRPVTPGQTDGLRTEIVAGLEAGERVVSKGAVLVKLAQAAPAPDIHQGHAH